MGYCAITKYEIDTDESGSKYCGITLDWDYISVREINLSNLNLSYKFLKG